MLFFSVLIEHIVTIMPTDMNGGHTNVTKTLVQTVDKLERSPIFPSSIYEHRLLNNLLSWHGVSGNFTEYQGQINECGDPVRKKILWAYQQIKTKGQMTVTLCKNEEIFSRLHMRNLCIQQSILSTSLFPDVFLIFANRQLWPHKIFLAHTSGGGP